MFTWAQLRVPFMSDLHRRPSLVVADRPGRLGNQILVLANLIASAIENESRVSAPGFDEAARNLSYFKGAYCRFPIKRRVPLNLEKLAGRIAYSVARAACGIVIGLGAPRSLVAAYRATDIFDPVDLEKLMDSERCRVVLLQGWKLRNPTAFERHADQVREILRPSRTATTAATRFFESIREPGRLIVGLHVRRGDYRQHLGGRYFYDWDTYVSFANQIVRNPDWQDVRVVVCSDDEVPAGLFDGLPVRISRGSAIEDLALLSMCDRIVAPPSSFSLVASMFGKTPLLLCTDAEVPISDEDFRIFPEVIDERVRYEYGL